MNKYNLRGEPIQSSPPDYSQAQFWGWNSDLDPAEMHRQRALVEEAGQRGIGAWLHDEVRSPTRFAEELARVKPEQCAHRLMSRVDDQPSLLQETRLEIEMVNPLRYPTGPTYRRGSGAETEGPCNFRRNPLWTDDFTFAPFPRRK